LYLHGYTWSSSFTLFHLRGGVGLETYGDDLELVKTVPASDMWAVVDGDGDQWILTGIHTVNRICYLITSSGQTKVIVEI